MLTLNENRYLALQSSVIGSVQKKIATRYATAYEEPIKTTVIALAWKTHTSISTRDRKVAGMMFSSSFTSLQLTSLSRLPE